MRTSGCCSSLRNLAVVVFLITTCVVVADEHDHLVSGEIHKGLKKRRDLGISLVCLALN